ncbi:MAG: hypothetical protein H7288_15395 [Kineosporiaceae bacterium]|nr:hypothetical protein [Aeromicrobium sp.]
MTWRLGVESFGWATAPFRAFDNDGDGIPEKDRAVAVAGNASAAVKGAASSVTDALGSVFRRKTDKKAVSEQSTNEAAIDES